MTQEQFIKRLEEVVFDLDGTKDVDLIQVWREMKNSTVKLYNELSKLEQEAFFEGFGFNKKKRERINEIKEILELEDNTIRA